MIHISKCSLEFEREKLLSPFGFKGGYLSELWQPTVKIEADGMTAVCPSVQSVLWSDPAVFTSNSEAAGNALMFSVTAAACRMLEGVSFENPAELTKHLAQELKKYADGVCGRSVQKTFVLNALVGIDLALWMLYAKKNRICSFDGIIPNYCKPTFSYRHEKLAKIPLVSYAVSEEEIKKLLDNGTGLLKIKLGRHVSGAEGSNEDMRAMLMWDIDRLKQIHTIAKEYVTPLTKDGHVRYYLDANGRYDSADRLSVFLEAADRMDALDRIELIEEPFPESKHIDVSMLDAVIGADESAHSIEDLETRLLLGYRAVALKPCAKTLSLSFAMADMAISRGAGCLTADLTVNPLLAMWNMQFAARIQPMSGMAVGCVEVNGDQNYVGWQRMKALMPEKLRDVKQTGGKILTDEGFYASSGELFGENGYEKLFIK